MTQSPAHAPLPCPVEMLTRIWLTLPRALAILPNCLNAQLLDRGACSLTIG